MLKISLNRTLQIYELLPQPMQAVVWRMLEKIAFGLRDTEDNEKLLKKKKKSSLHFVVERTTGPGYGNRPTQKPGQHLSLSICIVQWKMNKYFLQHWWGTKSVSEWTITYYSTRGGQLHCFSLPRQSEGLETFCPLEEEKFKGKPVCHTRARENSMMLEKIGN